jgi:hypothetical protein
MTKPPQIRASRGDRMADIEYQIKVNGIFSVDQSLAAHSVRASPTS